MPVLQFHGAAAPYTPGAQTSEFEQDQHRRSTRIPPLLCRKAVVIAGAPVSAARDETQT